MLQNIIKILIMITRPQKEINPHLPSQEVLLVEMCETSRAEDEEVVR